MQGGFKLGHAGFRSASPRKMSNLAAQLLRGDMRGCDEETLKQSLKIVVSAEVDRLASALQERKAEQTPPAEPRDDPSAEEQR